MSKQIRKSISIVILVAFFGISIKGPAFAQISEDPMPFMPKPGIMVHLSPEYTPAYLKGIVIHPENALKFDFIIYKGDKELTDDQKKDEYTKLTKYFLASLAIPDDDQWVNLSPYEKDRIIKDDFGKTEMGRDLLAQDYLLKQITASLIYPEDSLGKKFWNKVYAEAQQQYGTTDIPVNTFNKVWILPDSALIYEKDNTAYVLRSHLKVMLEEDYLALQKHSGIQSAPMDNKTHSIASKVVKEIVLPELEREVNEDKNFATVRQVYSGMLLATWYKHALKESLLSRIYADKSKVKGVDQDPQNNEVIYRQYLRAYKKGVFNFIKEDVDRYTNETIPRKYFSGGEQSWAMTANQRGIREIARVGIPAVIQTTDSPDAFAEAQNEVVTDDVATEQVTEDVPLSVNVAGTAPQSSNSAMTAKKILPPRRPLVAIFDRNTKVIKIASDENIQKKLSITLYRLQSQQNAYWLSFGYEGGDRPFNVVPFDSFTPVDMRAIGVSIFRQGDKFTIANNRGKYLVVTIDKAMTSGDLSSSWLSRMKVISSDERQRALDMLGDLVLKAKNMNGAEFKVFTEGEIKSTFGAEDENVKAAVQLLANDVPDNVDYDTIMGSLDLLKNKITLMDDEVFQRWLRDNHSFVSEGGIPSLNRLRNSEFFNKSGASNFSLLPPSILKEIVVGNHPYPGDYKIMEGIIFNPDFGKELKIFENIQDIRLDNPSYTNFSANDEQESGRVGILLKRLTNWVRKVLEIPTAADRVNESRAIAINVLNERENPKIISLSSVLHSRTLGAVLAERQEYEALRREVQDYLTSRFGVNGAEDMTPAVMHNFSIKATSNPGNSNEYSTDAAIADQAMNVPENLEITIAQKNAARKRIVDNNIEGMRFSTLSTRDLIKFKTLRGVSNFLNGAVGKSIISNKTDGAAVLASLLNGKEAILETVPGHSTLVRLKRNLGNVVRPSIIGSPEFDNIWNTLQPTEEVLQRVFKSVAVSQYNFEIKPENTLLDQENREKTVDGIMRDIQRSFGLRYTLNPALPRVETKVSNPIVNLPENRPPENIPPVNRQMNLPFNQAMTAKGGIDFNSANLSLQIKRDGHGVPLPISQQDLEHINIDGLIPVIIAIKPATSLPIFTELQNTPS